MKRLGLVLPILAGLMWGALPASATTVTATLTIPVALEVRLPGVAIEIESAPGLIGSIELGVATNDWPLQVQAYALTDGPTPALDFRFLPLATPEADVVWTTLGEQDDPALVVLPLPGEQRYRLEVRRVEGGTGDRNEARVVLVFETRSGKRVTADVLLDGPCSGPS